MVARNVSESILDGGIRSVNFFNGRLLSGEDLTQEHMANSEARRRLALAIGDGIAFGLQVQRSADSKKSGAPPTVTILPGLAVNRQGQTLTLTTSVDLSLVRMDVGGTASNSQTLFTTCSPPQSGSYIAGAGVYLLTIAPASGSEGRAPVSGLGNVVASCNSRYSVEGVQFRLIQVDVPLSELQQSDLLRNVLAHACFGTSDTKVQNFFVNPFDPTIQAGYGLLDGLRQGNSAGAGCLGDDDVPLALLYWTVDDGIKFIDLWSVRRRITRSSADTNWPLLINDRRLSEAEAMYLQFEEQVQNISTNEVAAMPELVATQRFAYLPPAGILPIQGGGSLTGFTAETFFGVLASRDVATMDANTLRILMHEALYHEPIDLAETGSRIQLYVIWENIQAISKLLTDQMILVFASHTLPYRGVAHFGSAKFDLSRFTPSVR